MNILHLDASASKHAETHTRGLSAELVDRLKTTHRKSDVVYHDLAEMRLPHIDTTILTTPSPSAAAIHPDQII